MGVRAKAHLPPCKEKQRLRTLCAEAVRRHRRAITEILEVRGKISNEEYERFRELADQARNARSAARLALQQHKQEHGC